jgi:hypothetical protein
MYMFLPGRLSGVMNTIEERVGINEARSSFNIGIVGIFGLFLLFTWSYATQAGTNECMTCVTYGDDRTECTPFPCPPPPRSLAVDLGPYQGVASIMAKVKHNDDLVDTVHKNPFILEAAGLFLDLADSNGLPEEDLEFVFRRFFSNPQWDWTPITNIKRARKGLYIMSIGSAVSTQDSSLYLFEERAHHKIDSGKRGCIAIEDVSAEGTIVTVRYNTHMGQPKTATLTKKGAAWTVTRTKQEQ